MVNEFEGKIDAEGKFELTRPFWKRLGGAFASPKLSRKLARAAQKKRRLDWYDIRDFPLDTERKDEFITGFPRRGGDCILILSITEGATAQIKFDSLNAQAFELSGSRRFRHNFSNLYMTNAAQSGATLKLLFGKGDWEVVRHHPEEKIVAINADTVDGLHASASVEPGSLLALGADGFFPCGAVRCLQNELFANQPATPVAGDVFISRDTGELYICFADGAWTNILTPSADQIAFTPAGDIIATDVQAAIEELDAEKLADVADVINDTHIDWGLGANEVSAADMPIADPGGIIVAIQVEGALQEIMTDLNAVEVDLNGFPDELKNLTAAEIQQLENINLITITNAQWGYLGACTAAGGALLDDANADAQLTTLGLSQNLGDLTDVEAAQLENIGPTTISAAQWGIVGALTTHPMGGDGTAGRILRLIELYITDGSNVATLKCQVVDKWNGDVIGITDNITKGVTTGHFTLSADGKSLTIEASGLTGNSLGALGFLNYNSTGTDYRMYVLASAGNIAMNVKNPITGANQDITTVVDTGFIYVIILYVTDA